MKELLPEYRKQLVAIAEFIQASEELAKFLEDEEDEDYQSLRQLAEPKIAELHSLVANNHPLQLLAFEKEMLIPELEGLYLPRILGYAVLRGVLNDNYKYIMPQDHFREILLSICDSSNFDYIRKRIGQTIQMGFALSSDIWVTNLINEIPNKRIRYFLQSQKLPRYRVLKERRIGYIRYKNQFRNDHYSTTEFPSEAGKLKIMFPSIRQFMHHRIQKDVDNASIYPAIREFLQNESFKTQEEYLEFLVLFTLFFAKEKADEKLVKEIIDDLRQSNPELADEWLALTLKMRKEGLSIGKEEDMRMFNLLDMKKEDKLSRFYQLAETIHTKGYIHEDTIEAVKVEINQHEGLSVFNESVRQTILSYFTNFMTNIETEEYTEYFNISKMFPVYMDVFSNQQFNQSIKDVCLVYVKKLLKKYTDKRGKDYQDIKKFVSASFLDLGFMKEKEITEMFKTRRKKKPVS